jgi:hypothetical protein
VICSGVWLSPLQVTLTSAPSARSALTASILPSIHAVYSKEVVRDSEFCEAEPYRVLVSERFEALVVSGKVTLSDADANSSAERLDSEVSLLDFAESKGGTLLFKFIESIRQLLINKINLLLR